MRFYETKVFVFLLAAVLAAVFLVVNFLNLNDYGETWDESVHWRNGEINWQVITGQAPIDQIETNHNLKYYGPLADLLGQGSKMIFTDKLNWLNEVAAHHVPLVIFGAILLGAVYGLGYLAGGTLTAFLSSIFLLLFPRFIGESQGNPKDLPVAALAALAMMLFVWAWSRKKWWQFILAGAVLGAALAVRTNALWVPLIILVWILISDRDLIKNWFKTRSKAFSLKEKFKRWGWAVIAYPFIAFGTMLAFWPWLWPAPLNRFWEAVVSVGSYDWTGLVKYAGKILPAPDLPWHYAPVMLFWVTPALILALAVIGSVIAVRQSIQKTNRVMILFPVWLTVVLGSIILLRISVYDGIRHFFLVVPALAVLAGGGGAFVYHWLAKKYSPGAGRRLALIVWSVILFIGGGSIFYKMILIHPYQLYYFNELIGGMGGAYPDYEVGYWGIEMKGGAEWLNQNVSGDARIAVQPTDKMAIPFLRSDLKAVKEKDNPDYSLALTKANYDPFKSLEPIYVLNIDGAPLLKIKKITPEVHE